jgi:hypothetical protein
MHDIDRTQHEYGESTLGYGETGFESTYGETPLGEIIQEAAYEGGYEGGYESPSFEYGVTGELGEDEVMELAAEFLEIQSEQDLEQFLGGLFKKVGKLAGGLTKIAGPQLSGLLKGVVKQALPIVKQAAGAALPLAGGALGSLVGGPVGGMIGSNLAGNAASMFGLEFGELSQEDREYEGAKQVVRLAESAIKQTAQAGPQAGAQAAVDAVTNAASQFMPGLLRPGGGAPGLPGGMGAPQVPGAPPQHRHRKSRGTWVRMGHRIVLYGV